MIIVFDIGTSRLKVSAFSISGELLGQTAAAHDSYHEGDHAWQSTEDWWLNACRSFERLIHDNDLKKAVIQGFSVSGRAGAGIFINAAGDVVVEPWLDRRHAQHLRELNAASPQTAIYANTLIAKYLWLQQNRPEQAKQITHALYAKDYLLFRLTGQCISDPSSGPDNRGWPTSIDQRLLPAQRLPWELAGELTIAAASELNCPVGIPVAVGAHDGICANTGCAMIDEGEYALTLGTHAVSRTVTSIDCGPAERFYCYPPDKHVYGGNSWYVGATLSWALSEIGGLTKELSAAQLQEFNSHLANINAYPELLFLPYPGGQTLPEKRRANSGEFQGIGTTTTSDQMLLAVFQGCAFAIYRTHQAIQKLIGKADAISITGGGVVFEPWLQMLADLLQQPLTTTDLGVEGRGAAIFCAVALGEYDTVIEAANAMQPDCNLIEPKTRSQQTEKLLASFEELSQNN